MSTTAPFSIEPPDLTACDREPIHIPGTIQPHGFLLGAEESSGRVRYASANVRELLDLDPALTFGRPMEELLGPAVAGAMRHGQLDPLFSRRAVLIEEFTKTVGGITRTFVLLGHRHAGNIIIEGELLPESSAVRDTHYQLENFLMQMEATATIGELLQLAAEETRRITGFDRVMVYRFDPDWNGIVIAEDRNDVLPSYLDLRFPASDIPRQARELYRTNRLRLIASASYTPVPLLAARRDGTPLDLSLSTLRSVSPVHLEYMRNMGTGSSMSISLIRAGQLWGLISCHSREARTVPFEVRSTCDLLGQVLSLQLAARESAATLSYRVELRSVVSSLMASMARHETYVAGLTADPKTLLAVAAATGVAVVANNEITIHGRTPTKAQIDQLAHWLASAGKEEVFSTETLGNVYPAAKEFSWTAAGLLAISLSKVNRSFVLWFRPEVISTVTWGGDPHKPAEKDPSSGAMRIHPRKSFETWVETVRGRSEPWQAAEIESVRELRFAIIEIVLQSAERLAQITEELTRTNKELETFSYTVSHDLRAPFRHIRAYTELLKMEKGRLLDDEGRQFVEFILGGATYAGRLVDNIIAFSQMGRNPLTISTVSLDELLQDVLSDMRIDVAKREIQWDVGPLPTIEGDAAMLRTVLQNLLENALKFTRDRKPARIEIRATETPAEVTVSIKDNGVGFDPKYRDKLFGMFQRLHRWEEFEGTGVGLASVRRIVGRHGGRVWADSTPGEGATFQFTLPRKPVTSTTLYA